MKQKYILIGILSFTLIFIHCLSKNKVLEYKEPELIFNKKAERINEILDINSVHKKDFLERNINLKLAEKIIEYRDFTGVIEDMSELGRIKGIGKKTLEKLKLNFRVEERQARKNKININSAEEKYLRWYGFEKKEIKKIVDYRKKNRFIYSNIELMDLIGNDRYNKIGMNIKYIAK